MNKKKSKGIRGAAFFLLYLAGIAWLWSSLQSSREDESKSLNPVTWEPGKWLWWDEVPEAVKKASYDTGSFSNLARKDYVGAENCRGCHKENYEAWAKHPHRWMNALATRETVKGAFSGDARMDYLGGEVWFFMEGDQYRMEMKRGDIHRKYAVNQTIGSRHLQFYVGKQLEGPEAPTHPSYSRNHVLPFGYWISGREWMPATSVGDEETQFGELSDPFKTSGVAVYSQRCIHCHTTIPFGDWLLKHPIEKSSEMFYRHFVSRKRFSFSPGGYLSEAYPDSFEKSEPWANGPTPNITRFLKTLRKKEASEIAANLGISCEACHLGGRVHAANSEVPPKFFPAGQNLYVHRTSDEKPFGRSTQNLNWICGRCHSTGLPKFAGGMSTQNSAEYNDAMAGSCYSELTCVNCHDPHVAIGPAWKLSPNQDDALCLQCHKEVEPAPARLAHTHHPAGTEGDRCMNCHMPRITEGLVSIIRTHTIFSPTNTAMIEANEPNACNLCHVEKSINWTLNYLKEWYGTELQEKQLPKYSNRDGSAAIGWMKSPLVWTRMASASALTGSRAFWAMPELVNFLDDSFPVARHLHQIGMDKMLGRQLKDMGYQFYTAGEERKQSVERLQKLLAKDEQPHSTELKQQE